MPNRAWMAIESVEGTNKDVHGVRFAHDLCHFQEALGTAWLPIPVASVRNRSGFQLVVPVRFYCGSGAGSVGGLVHCGMRSAFGGGKAEYYSETVRWILR